MMWSTLYHFVLCTILYIRVANSTCPEGAEVAEMCIPSVSTGSRVMIDMSTATGETHDCKCTFNTTANTVKFMTRAAPNYSNCGTAVNVEMDSGASMKFECLISGSFFDTTDNKTGSITLEQTAPPLDKNYCLILENVGGSWDTVSVTCTKRTGTEPSESTPGLDKRIIDENLVPSTSDAQSPVFSAPEVPSNTSIIKVSSTKTVVQGTANTAFLAPEQPSESSSNEETNAVSNVQTFPVLKPNPDFSSPVLPKNNEVSANENVQPVMHESVSPVFSVPDLPLNSGFKANTSLIAVVTDASANKTGQTNITGITSVFKSSPTETFTAGAILFQGSRNESKQKQYQSISLVNNTESGDVRGALNVQSVDKTFVLDAEKHNETQAIQHVDGSTKDTGMVANQTNLFLRNVSLLPLPSSDIVLNAESTNITKTISRELSSDNNAFDTIKTVKGFTEENVIMDASFVSNSAADLTEKNKPKGGMEHDSLFSSDDKRLTMNSTSNSSSDNNILDLLKGILPVIAESVNITQKEQSAGLNISDNMIGTYDTSGKVVTDPKSSSSLPSSNNDLTVESFSPNMNSIGELSPSVRKNFTSDTTFGPQKALSTTAGATETTTGMEEASTTDTIIMSTSRVPGSIQNNFLTGDMLPLKDETKQQPTDFLISEDKISTAQNHGVSGHAFKISTESPTLTISETDTSLSSNEGIDFQLPAISNELNISKKANSSQTGSTYIDGQTIETTSNPGLRKAVLLADDNATVSPVSVEVKTVRTPEMPPQESNRIDVVSEDATTTVSVTSTRRLKEPEQAKRHEDPVAEPQAEPTDSSVKSLTERLSANSTIDYLDTPKLILAKSAAIVSSSEDVSSAIQTVSTNNFDTVTKSAYFSTSKTDAATTTQTVENLKMAANILTPVNVSNFNLSVKQGPLVSSYSTTESPILRSDLSETMSEPVNTVVIPNRESTVLNNPTHLADLDLSFKIVRLLKLLTMKSASDSILDSTLSAALENGVTTETTTPAASENGVTTETTTPAALVGDISFSRETNETYGSVGSNITNEGRAINTVDGKVKHFQNNYDKSHPTEAYDENPDVSTDTSVPKTETVTESLITADRTKQSVIKEVVKEPRDADAKSFHENINETITEKIPELVQTTKEAYSVVVEKDQLSEPNVRSDKIDKSVRDGEDDPVLFGIDRSALIIILAVVGGAILLLICMGLVVNRRRKKRTASAPITRNGFTVDNIVYDSSYSDPEKGSSDTVEAPDAHRDVQQPATSN